MQEILYRYRKYDIEYNRGLGIITINKKIPVKDFLELKNMASRVSGVKEIRVDTIKVKRWNY